MQDTDYPVAYWGKSWGEVTQYGKEADSESVQGVANLIDNVPILHASLGELLPISPNKLPESSLPKPEYLYGYSKFGDYFALRDPTLMNAKHSLHGAYEQNIKGIFLFAGKNSLTHLKR